MGQQQLLLLVLGVIIVGIALVVGIRTFSENRAEAASDEVVVTANRIATMSIPWVLSARALGGGGGDPSTLTFANMGYDVESDGSYRAGDGVFTLDATSARILVRGEIAQTGFHVVSAVFGPDDDCLVTETQANTAPAVPTAPAGCTW